MTDENSRIFKIKNGELHVTLHELLRTATAAHLVIAFVEHAEGWVFESQLRPIAKFLSSIVKCTCRIIGVKVTVPGYDLNNELPVSQYM